MPAQLGPGTKAPPFSLPRDGGGTVSLADFKGQNLVLFFYPRADTPGCTIESCEFRDTAKKFTKKGVTILGVSPDTTKAQAKFKEKFDLNFTLLADDDKTIANLYGVMKEKNMYGKMLMGVARTTFVIDGGKVVKVFTGVKPEGHAEEVLATL